jgi:hypothetical protein
MESIGIQNEQQPDEQHSSKARTKHKSGSEKEITASTKLHDHPPAVTLGVSSERQDALRIQPQLSVNQPGDRHEQEAEGVAERVMSMPDATLHLQHNDDSQHVSHDGQHASGQLAMKPSATQQETGAAPTSFVQEALSSPGQPLDANTLTFMEARFGRDLSDVRVHADTQAAESAESLNANAYTVGRDIVFGLGQYAPGSDSGKRLIAHEVSHVLQQTEPPLLPARRGDSPQSGPRQMISHTPVNQRTPLIQRQPKTASTTFLPDIRKVLESKATPEMLALLKKIDLKKTTPQEIMKTVIDATKHVWELTLTFHNRAAGGSSTKPEKPFIDKKRGEVHQITSEVAFQHSTVDIPKTAPAMQIKTNLERGIYMTAQDLFHELTHVLLIIGRDITDASAKAGTTPTPAQTFKVRKEYQSTLDVVAGPSFKDPRDKVIDALALLFKRSSDLLNLQIPDDRFMAIATNDIEKLVNEKFTFGKAGEAFGFTPTNLKIATSYVPTYVMELFDPALGSMMHSVMMSRLGGNNGWNTLKNDAITQVTNLYNEIDKDLTLKGYILPGLMPTQPPAMPLPLQMSGTTVQMPGTVAEEKIDLSEFFPK